MKLKLLTVAVSTLLAAGTVQAAEVYNKDGNKLDLYGKVTGLHYFSSDKSEDGDQTYARLGFKGETQINDQLIGYGQWEYNFSANNVEGDNSGDKTRLAFAGLKLANLALWTTAVTTASPMISAPGPICCRSLAAILGPRPMSSPPRVPPALPPTVTAVSSAWLTA